MIQISNLEKLLAWIKSSPCQFTISSMSGGFVHVKFLVPCDKEIAQMVELEDRDALIDKCYDDGFKDGRKTRKGITDREGYIPVDDDGVWTVSVTTMNLLYAMYLWADKSGIDNEDDWENHLQLMREHLDNLQGASE